MKLLLIHMDKNLPRICLSAHKGLKMVWSTLMRRQCLQCIRSAFQSVMCLFFHVSISQDNLEIAVTILNELADTDAVLFVLVIKPKKFLLSRLSSCEQSLWFMLIRIGDLWSAKALGYIHLFCLLVLMIYVPINNFSHVGANSCLPGAITKQKIKPLPKDTTLWIWWESWTSNPSNPQSNALQMSQCALYVHF